MAVVARYNRHLVSLKDGIDVHFVLPGGQHRPAKVVRVWPADDGTTRDDGLVNLVVFLDGPNDDPENGRCIQWEPAIRFSQDHEAGTWHFGTDN